MESRVGWGGGAKAIPGYIQTFDNLNKHINTFQVFNLSYL